MHLFIILYTSIYFAHISVSLAFLWNVIILFTQCKVVISWHKLCAAKEIIHSSLVVVGR